MDFKAHIEIEDEPEQNYSTGKMDGSRSTTRGLCDCGYKHWLHGEEYDFVVRPEGFPAILGFNVTDNEYVVAEKFVMKYDRSNNLNHRNKIAAIVEFIAAIRQKALLNAGITQPLPTSQEPKFDPTKAIFSHPTKNLTHYNKVTGKFDTAIYIDKDLQHYTPEEVAENVRKWNLLKEENKKIDDMIKNREKATTSISDKVKMDRQEVDAAAKRRNQIQSYKKDSPNKPNMIRVVKNGVIEYVESTSTSVSPQHTSSQPETRWGDIQGLHNKKNNHPNYCEHCDTIHDHDDHDHDDNEEEDYDEHGKRFISVPTEFMSKVKRSFEKYNGKLPKEKWSKEILIIKLLQDSLPYKKTQQLMLECGFHEYEVHSLIKDILTTHFNFRDNVVDTIFASSSTLFSLPTPTHIPSNDIINTTTNTTILPPTSIFNSLTPSQTSSPTTSTLEPSPPLPEVHTPENPPQLIQIEENKPTTSIKVRLVDGKTVTVTVNLDNTLEQLYGHVRALSNFIGPFKLMDMTSRPSKALTDMTLTVQKANIARGSISQVKL